MKSKGQFMIIAALLVAVVLVATVVVTFSTIRNNQIQESPPIQNAIDETNFAMKQILGFSVGYYGSVLKVTGNSSYAKMLATNYLRSGLDSIASIHPEWAASLALLSSDFYTYWFANTSSSRGNLSVAYNLTGLGISGVNYATSCNLEVFIANTTNNRVCLKVIKDEGEPMVNLGKRNFKFFRYENLNSTWELVDPSSEPVTYANGTYQIGAPTWVDVNSYLIQVEDPRGMIVVASSYSVLTYDLNWPSMPTLSSVRDTITVELLQNGSMRWLGQNLELTMQGKPIPPLPVRSIHLNQTIDGVNCEVPFQIEDWASSYKIPLGLTSNQSVFSGKTMLVFLANSNVSRAKLWWDGSDLAEQTSYAYVNRYFTGDSPSTGKLTNGILTLQFGSGFVLDSSVGTSSCRATFMRVNREASTYGSGLAYTITKGIVRDVIHQEPEWEGGVDACPNFYAHIVITLPANVTYYTYSLRMMFVESNRNRDITDLCPIKLETRISQLQTENGTIGGCPIIWTGTGLLYNFSTQMWAHHWSQFISGTRGAGIMFTDKANQQLYVFDNMAGKKTGCLKVDSMARAIELLPVTMAPVNFTSALDVTWHGAVTTFDNTIPIYRETSGEIEGSWISVEYPPTIAVNAES